MTALVLALALAADLSAIKAEPDQGKRAVKALDYSFQQLAEARKLVDAGEFDKMKELVPSIAEGAELAQETLSTGKKNAGNIKKAEKRCNDLLRRLETFRQDLPSDDRAPVEQVEKRVHSVQDQLIGLIMRRSK